MLSEAETCRFLSFIFYLTSVKYLSLLYHRMMFLLIFGDTFAKRILKFWLRLFLFYLLCLRSWEIFPRENKVSDFRFPRCICFVCQLQLSITIAICKKRIWIFALKSCRLSLSENCGEGVFLLLFFSKTEREISFGFAVTAASNKFLSKFHRAFCGNERVQKSRKVSLRMKSPWEFREFRTFSAFAKFQFL